MPFCLIDFFVSFPCITFRIIMSFRKFIRPFILSAERAAETEPWYVLDLPFAPLLAICRQMCTCINVK